MHPNQISKWKKQALEEMPKIFSGGKKNQKGSSEKLESELYKQIGQLKVELDWLKKYSGYSTEEKRLLIERNRRRITVNRQCELIGLTRSSYYYKTHKHDKTDNNLMRLIDKKYTKTPFYGIRRITNALKSMGFVVNHKRIARLMGVMGIEAIYPKPHLSKPHKESKKYPYFKRGLQIERPNYVWSKDITYIRLRNDFVYLAAIMDWFSSYVISWALSNTLDTFFCFDMLEKSLNSAQPKIFNSDQGTQFTSEDFTG